MLIRSLLASCLVLSALPAAATPPDQIFRAELLPGWREGGRHIAALRLRLAPEWKTYWRSPGEAGIPPEFDWSGSENVARVHMHWPVPSVFNLNGMQTIGYRDELVLPFEIETRDPTRPVHLKARVDLGVCRDICVPAEFELQAELPPAGAPDSVISTAMRSRPESGLEAGVGRIACRVEPINDGLRLTAELDLPAMGASEVVVLEPGTSAIWTSEAVTSRQGARLTAVSDLVGPGGAPFALDRSALTVTVLGDRRAVEIRGCPAP
ncbi:protein-disulfide reductase DsbD domain-containing protein [Cereibacter azotoformans]|uniref:protein-disulfide reductase DsbD domain-containing protein n=1 Tax=Cereibacter azotoformans TaxID=43057 RepID=UPI003B2168F6